ncbi:MAG TPA: DUF790 family protein [Polyangiaceae bacterium]|nr:DUF790 family protein [Polyangiaceae bacterium]
MLPQSLLAANVQVHGERLIPHYFGARDEPWLRGLLAEYAHFVGRKRTELHERLREPLSVRAPQAKLRVAILVLDALCRARPSSAIPAKEARAALFRAASGKLLPRVTVLSAVATAFGVTADDLERALFADLRSEWRVAELPVSLSAARLARDANLAIVTSLIRRAAQLRIVVRGNFRALVRHAKVTGLICRESPLADAAEGVALDVSGPFTLFHQGEIYGRALASLIPRLASCEQFELTASCALGRSGQLSSFVLRSDDPIGSGPAFSRSESHLERRFARDFRRAAPGWQLSADPFAISSGETLIFPDFELVARDDPGRSWLLEIIGFWTPDYLRGKLQRLQAAGIERFVLCVDQNRDCTRAELPADPRITWHKRRIDARAVLAILTAPSTIDPSLTNCATDQRASENHGAAESAPKKANP